MPRSLIGERLLRNQGWDGTDTILGTSGFGLSKPLDGITLATGGLNSGLGDSKLGSFSRQEEWSRSHLEPFHNVLSRVSGFRKRALSSPNTEMQLPKSEENKNEHRSAKVSSRKRKTKMAMNDSINLKGSQVHEVEDDADFPLVFSPHDTCKSRISPILGSRRVVYQRQVNMRTKVHRCKKSLNEVLGKSE